MSNLKRDIEGVLKEFEQEYSDAYTEPDDGIDFDRADKAIKTATTQIIDLIESVVDNLKPDTNLLGCDKHWSDDSGGTCTCDENERTAIRFYEKAKDDIKSKLIGKE